MKKTLAILCLSDSSVYNILAKKFDEDYFSTANSLVTFRCVFVTTAFLLEKILWFRVRGIRKHVQIRTTRFLKKKRKINGLQHTEWQLCFFISSFFRGTLMRGTKNVDQIWVTKKTHHRTKNSRLNENNRVSNVDHRGCIQHVHYTNWSKGRMVPFWYRHFHSYIENFSVGLLKTVSLSAQSIRSQI